ncbi:MAG TPA: hypothetical protein VEA61_04800 [Allosphingosinicella sp.]|nr:hypothetical protein [Allosphingosinicella sp.]
MAKYWKFGVAALALAVGACGQPAFRMRWADGSLPLQRRGEPVLAVTSLAADPASSTGFKDLAERSGAAYAAALAAKTGTAAEYRAALAEPIKGAGRSNIDRTALPRVIALDVSPGGYSAGDRLVWTRVTLLPIDFRFSDFALAKTEYQTIDLETITSTSKETASLTISPTIGSPVEAAEAVLSAERSDQTVYGNRERIRDLSVGFDPQRIVVTRDGGPGIDLAGITLLKVSARPVSKAESDIATLVSAYKIVDDNGADLQPSAASMSLSLDRVWRPRPLFVCGRLDYVRREVLNGAEFYDEGHHRVQEREGQTIGVYQLAPEADVETAQYLIVDSETGSAVEIDAPASGTRTFAFSNLGEATAFSRWLSRTGADKVGSQTLSVRDPATGRPRPLSVRKGRVFEVQRRETANAPPEPTLAQCRARFQVTP